jgi:hypothetical protein
MKKLAVIATRTTEEEQSNPDTTVGKLNQFLVSAGWCVTFVQNANSMFEAHKAGTQGVEDEDFVILCHDDIEILLDEDRFNDLISSHLNDEKVGFVGVAGSSKIGTEIGWFQCARAYGSGSGACYHGKTVPEMFLTFFGPAGKVVALDGVFLAASGKTINSIKVAKPVDIKSTWDWYDFFYCVQAHMKGKENRTIPLPIRHESGGRYPQVFFDDIPRWKKLLVKHLPLVVR